MKTREKLKVKTTHGKNGVPELPAYQDHLRFSTVVCFYSVEDRDKLGTVIGIACRVSDADLRSN